LLYLPDAWAHDTCHRCCLYKRRGPDPIRNPGGCRRPDGSGRRRLNSYSKSGDDLVISSCFGNEHSRIATLAAVGLTLAGCADQGPASPTVLALPAQGENFTLFHQHDATCRQYASGQTGGQSPGQAAAKTGVAGAAIGTGIGVAAGALLGSASGHAGGGAAIGAGSGLLTGSLLGSASGRQAAQSTQKHYNLAYTQCMIANGEHIAPPPAPPPPPMVYLAPPPVVYAAPPAGVVFVPGPVYAAPPPGATAMPPGR
jgi:hypothetical protein